MILDGYLVPDQAYTDLKKGVNSKNLKLSTVTLIERFEEDFYNPPLPDQERTLPLSLHHVVSNGKVAEEESIATTDP